MVSPARPMSEGAEASPITFPPELPISARVLDIAKAIDAHPVVIVAGATGSGKTTQLPKIALAMGRGLERIVGVTQPRRLAATSVAARVASELGTPLGTDVGYQIRFDDRTSERTYVKFMTDGILLAEIHGDPLLRRYDTLIIDEAHERSLTIDFLLGWVKRILPERPDLKVVVSSATLETDRFSKFFGGAPVVAVEGRTFPVDVLYEPPPEDADLAEAVAGAVEEITSLDPRGDILVFLPGEREIREAEGELLRRSLRHTVIQPLYARLTAAEQARIFADIPERRVILATNVAETSLTIPRIVYVVDTGVARLSRYDARSGTTTLHVEAISQASAEQRKGRCGRVREGICVRLYDEESFRARPAFTDPEIKRTGLAGVILRMKSLGLGDVDAFPFLDPPDTRAVTEGYRVLEELGALGEKRTLTPLGERLARFPVDPRIARMILAGAEHGCLREVLVVAAALSVQDVRERPREAQERADQSHRRFTDERSDFIGLLRLWDFIKTAEKKGTGNLRRTCKESFLSFVRVREWTETHRQLEDVVGELRLPPRKSDGKSDKLDEDALHRALVTGLLSKIGKWNPEQRVYMGAKQTRFFIHPSSALAKKPPQWIMAVELVETSQLFARMCARIDPAWLAEAGPHLVKRSYADPHWSERTARAVVKEHSTLFGITIERDKSVDYAKVAPAAARRMFLEHALVRGEFQTRGAFAAKNAAVLDEAARLRAKARRSDMMADDSALTAFFEARVPDEVVDGKTFEAWRERAEKSDPNVLHLSLADALLGEPDLSPDAFPDSVTMHGVSLPLTYTFDPKADEDGVSITVPMVLLPQLDPGELEWTVPGWLREKVLALLYELPKGTRRDLGDLGVLAELVTSDLRPFAGPFFPALRAAVQRVAGASIEEGAFERAVIATHLRLTCRVVDEHGKLLVAGRDLDAIFARFGAKARAVLERAPTPGAFERQGLVRWDFGDLPPFIVRRVGKTDVRAYPALLDRGDSVDLVLRESEPSARAASRAGVRRLLMLACRREVQSALAVLPRALPAATPETTIPSRADDAAFRDLALARIADEAWGLGEGASLPRTERELSALAAAGAPRLYSLAKALADALGPVAAELAKTLASLRTAAKQPSGRAAVHDLYAHLASLFPADLVAWVPLDRLVHYPRYLRAAQARLTRAITDPRKDEAKLAPFAPLWAAYQKRADKARDVALARDVRFMFEELRVSIFAPELKTAFPVSLARVKEALDALE